MRIKLDYGRTGLWFTVPGDQMVEVLRVRSAPVITNPHDAIESVLHQPNGTLPLGELARRRRSACIAICDITRPVPNRHLLPPILQTLEEAGIPRERIVLLVATGLHRPNMGAELEEIVGADIAQNYRIENHDGQATSEHTYLGTTANGVPAWIDSRYVNADLKIAIGLIEPHLMAGFSGGRKVICPGLASLETIKVWHGPQFLEHPLACCGSLIGNPVHEENTRIARMAGCDFTVNVCLDSDRQITWLGAGDLESSWLAGVRFVEQYVRVAVAKSLDIVVTSAAGYPLDSTWYQAVKGLVGALPIVKPGGTIILAASLSEGLGSAHFQKLIKDNADLKDFLRKITAGGYFVMDQWQLEEFAKVAAKCRVMVVSDGVSADVLRNCHVEPVESIELAIDTCRKDYGSASTLAVIPQGPYVLPFVAA